ncbi:MAG: hypothetical protein K8R45_13045 [Desulfobacterales bacterium]|nr:hypothetical protein [Desulfobacterales bacterium]
MLIIGERINTSRNEINEAVERKDANFIKADVRAQVEAGARIIDIHWEPKGCSGPSGQGRILYGLHQGV